MHTYSGVGKEIPGTYTYGTPESLFQGADYGTVYNPHFSSLDLKALKYLYPK